MTMLHDIITKCEEETVRQLPHHDVEDLLMGTSRLMSAYSSAILEKMERPEGSMPTLADLAFWAVVIEPSTKGRIRQTPVTFNTGGSALAPDSILRAMTHLQEWLVSLQEDDYLVGEDKHALVHRFLEIHPFSDANGRVAFILLNWLNDSLVCPVNLSEYQFV